jgi:hypothetical protein
VHRCIGSYGLGSVDIRLIKLVITCVSKKVVRTLRVAGDCWLGPTSVMLLQLYVDLSKQDTSTVFVWALDSTQVWKNRLTNLL